MYLVNAPFNLLQASVRGQNLRTPGHLAHGNGGKYECPDRGITQTCLLGRRRVLDKRQRILLGVHGCRLEHVAITHLGEDVDLGDAELPDGGAAQE